MFGLLANDELAVDFTAIFRRRRIGWRVLMVYGVAGGGNVSMSNSSLSGGSGDEVERALFAARWVSDRECRCRLLDNFGCFAFSSLSSLQLAGDDASMGSFIVTGDGLDGATRRCDDFEISTTLSFRHEREYGTDSILPLILVGEEVGFFGVAGSEEDPSDGAEDESTESNVRLR